jgi:hypothetical protein
VDGSGLDKFVIFDKRIKCKNKDLCLSVTGIVIDNCTVDDIVCTCIWTNEEIEDELLDVARDGGILADLQNFKVIQNYKTGSKVDDNFFNSICCYCDRNDFFFASL